MYSTPLKSKVNKNRASYLLSLLIKPEEKIRFAFCTDLLIENSLYYEDNEHYFQDPYLIEFWKNYNNNRKYLYLTVKKHIDMNKGIIQRCIGELQSLDSINRSSLLFLSNNLSENHLYGSEIIRTPELKNLPNLFAQPNKVSDFKEIKEYTPGSNPTVLECLVGNSYTKETFQYFTEVIETAGNIYIITDNPIFKKKFRKRIHINDAYYLCYDKEQQ